MHSLGYMYLTVDIIVLNHQRLTFSQTLIVIISAKDFSGNNWLEFAKCEQYPNEYIADNGRKPEFTLT